jgi:hypothetical protein
VKEIRNAQEFFTVLESSAKACDLTSAKLLKILLPFDENTSSSNQAEVIVPHRSVKDIAV